MYRKRDKNKFTLPRARTTQSSHSNNPRASAIPSKSSLFLNRLNGSNTNAAFMSPNRLRRLGNMFLSEEEKQKKINVKLNRMITEMTIPRYMKKEIINAKTDVDKL